MRTSSIPSSAMISQAASRMRSAVSVAIVPIHAPASRVAVRRRVQCLTLSPPALPERLHIALGNHRVKGVDVALVGRVAPRRVSAGAHALLRQLADAPVLAVDLVPEVDRVGG